MLVTQDNIWVVAKKWKGTMLSFVIYSVCSLFPILDLFYNYMVLFFIEGMDIDMQDIVQNGYKMSKIWIDCVYQLKVKSLWTKEKKREETPLNF